MCQWFAPTSLVVTCEGGNGIEEVVVRDESGRVTELKLPPQVVMMPNHQVRTLSACVETLLISGYLAILRYTLIGGTYGVLPTPCEHTQTSLLS
jgi:hypothetical protein